MKQKILVIVGPTASGKKKIAMDAAIRFNGEILSADSRKVYRYLDIGTAKPPRSERDRVTHHLIDIVDPDEPFSAGRWSEQASNIVKDITLKGKLPVISGGTGFYISAFMGGLSEGIEADKKVRERIERMLTDQGVSAIYNRLKEVDPERAGELHPNDTVRVKRALEIIETTGKTFSEMRLNGTTGVQGNYDIFMAGITRERENLYERINRRVQDMIAAGLEDEVRLILSKGYKKSLTSLDTVGYKEWWAYFDGEIGYGDCVNMIKQDTRRYAKRQLTWFRAKTGIKWYNPDIAGATEALFEDIEEWRQVEKC